MSGLPPQVCRVLLENERIKERSHRLMCDVLTQKLGIAVLVEQVMDLVEQDVNAQLEKKESALFYWCKYIHGCMEKEAHTDHCGSQLYSDSFSDGGDYHWLVWTESWNLTVDAGYPGIYAPEDQQYDFTWSNVIPSGIGWKIKEIQFDGLDLLCHEDGTVTLK